MGIGVGVKVGVGLGVDVGVAVGSTTATTGVTIGVAVGVEVGTILTVGSVSEQLARTVAIAKINSALITEDRKFRFGRLRLMRNPLAAR